jgi:hypothetical protein
VQTCLVDVSTGEGGLQESRQRQARALNVIGRVWRKSVYRIKTAKAETSGVRAYRKMMINGLKVVLTGGGQCFLIVAAPLSGAPKARSTTKIGRSRRTVEKAIAGCAGRRRKEACFGLSLQQVGRQGGEFALENILSAALFRRACADRRHAKAAMYEIAPVHSANTAKPLSRTVTERLSIAALK